MIEIEFRKPAKGSGYATVATLTVNDDATYRVDGETGVDLEEISILDRTAPGGRLTLAQDPERWARNVRKAFRTGYLVPVVIRDTATDSTG